MAARVRRALPALGGAARRPCHVVEAGKLERIPLTGQVAAISMGVVDGNTLLDLGDKGIAELIELQRQALA